MWDNCFTNMDTVVEIFDHYSDNIMSVMAFQITSLANVYSSVYSDADQRKHQSTASLAFLLRIRRSPVNSPHKWSVTRKMFPFDYVIMLTFVSILQNEERFTQWQTYIIKIDNVTTNLQSNIYHFQYSTSHNYNFIKYLQWYFPLNTENYYPYDFFRPFFTS